MGHSKTTLRGEFMEIQAYLKKKENFQINNVILYLEELEKVQTNPKVYRRKEIIKTIFCK